MSSLSIVTLPFLIIFAFPSAFAQDNGCSVAPISIPINNVSLSNGGSIRGISISVGTPQQSISFVPSQEVNNSYIYNGDYACATNATENFCITQHGGKFHQVQSSTFQAMPNASVTVETPNVLTSVPPLWGQDTFALASNLSVPDYPLGLVNSTLMTNPNEDQATLGLAKNSTLLSTLKVAGTIASLSWGYWWGLAGAAPATQMDGSLVLGGYDAAKVVRDHNYTGTMIDPKICPSGLTVTITSIVMNFPNGTAPDLLNPLLGSTALSACLCPECPVMMSLPSDPYYDRFEQWSNIISVGHSRGLNVFTPLYPSDDVYQGDLTITLDTGFSVRIANSQLVVTDRTISDEGFVISNSTFDDVLIYPLQGVNAHDIPRLGNAFFTAAYLLVNNDAGTFTLWEANPTTDIDIVSVTSNGSVNTCTATTSMPATVSSPSNSNSLNGQSQQDDATSLSAGVIAGIAVGGVVACAIVGFLVFYLIRRRKSRKSQAMARTEKEPLQSPGLWKQPQHGQVAVVEADSRSFAYAAELPQPRYDTIPQRQELYAGTPRLTDGSYGLQEMG